MRPMTLLTLTGKKEVYYEAIKNEGIIKNCITGVIKKNSSNRPMLAKLKKMISIKGISFINFFLIN